MAITKPAFIISSLTIFSRITGFVRDILIAKYLGAGILSDVFFAALKITNFLRKLLIHEGGFFAAFVPAYTEEQNKDQQNNTKNSIIFVSKIFSFLFWFLLSVVIIMEIVMPWFTKLISPGFEGEKLALTNTLSRICFIYFLFISLSSVFWGVLNSKGKYFYYGFVPCIWNISMIFFMVFLKDHFPTLAHCLVFGIVVGGAIQLLVSYLGCLKHGESVKLYNPIKSLRDKSAISTVKKMIPAIIGGGATQINTMIDTVLASFIPSAVSYLYYADRLYYFPYSVVGTTLSVAILPMLARAIFNQNYNEANNIQISAIKMGLILCIPAGLVFIIMSYFITDILFKRGAFNEIDLMYVSNIMTMLGFGLIFSTLNKIYSSVFFAYKNTKLPMQVTLISVIANIIISLCLFKIFGVYGIVFGTTSSYILTFGLNIYLLRKLQYLSWNHQMTRYCAIVTLSATIAIGLSYLLAIYLYYYKFSFLQDLEIGKLSMLAFVGLVCCVLYYIILRCFKVNAINVIFKV